jgi:hypothetical protein
MPGATAAHGYRRLMETLPPEKATAEDERRCATSPHAIFGECPQCGGAMAPEHAHYRCKGCGWRDSCCD